VKARSGLEGIEGILLDIEGTTTPIAFVFDVLFPYARRHLRRHLDQHATSPEYHQLFDGLRDEYMSDREAGEPVPSWVDDPAAARVASIASYCDWLMERDRKSTPLKELQGRIWKEGYERGELVSQVFADVPVALSRWSARNVQIGIFSSGSALAQQLLFRHSSAGDLTGFLRWYFDTTVGAKTKSESYRRITTTMELPAGAILFVSDVVSELDAARDAGMQTALSIRAGNKRPPRAHDHRVVETFEGLG
jgi:enolase-phosphatase E1